MVTTNVVRLFGTNLDYLFGENLNLPLIVLYGIIIPMRGAIELIAIELLLGVLCRNPKPSGCFKTPPDGVVMGLNSISLGFLISTQHA